MKGQTLAMSRDWKNLKKGQPVKILVEEKDYLYVYPLGVISNDPIGHWVDREMVK